MGDVVLVPVKFFRPWVAGMFGHPGHRLFTLEIHPVAVLWVDDPFMWVGAVINHGESIQFGPPLCCEFVAIIGGVFSSALDEVCEITEIVGFGIAWVSCHHCGSGPAVGHTWCQLIGAIASC